MQPIIAILGRPNVGKSTLFNQLTRSRNALVADQPGLTRDRIYGMGRLGDRPYVLVDTGGLCEGGDSLEKLVARQSLRAAEEADGILFLVDGREGPTANDERIAARLRSLGKPIQVSVNKTDGMDADIAAADFFALGLGSPIPISSAHGQGLEVLIETLLGALPEPEAEEESPHARGPRIAVVGRPNVGKSTLVNRMLGEERVLVYDQPGTTRDSISIPFERDRRPYTLIDTAGVRRRPRISQAIEKFSVIKTLQAIDKANVVILVIDAGDSVTDQDAALLGMVSDSGRALVIAVNKWDGLGPEKRRQLRGSLDRKLRFVDFASIHCLSALHGSGVGELFASIDQAYRCAFVEVSAGALTHMLEQAVRAFPPPLGRGGRRIKLRYAHLGGHNPPHVVIHGNQVDSLPESYRRYLDKHFRAALGLHGTPLRIELKQGDNPFKGIKNTLTPRQLARRKRLLQHAHRAGQQ